MDDAVTQVGSRVGYTEAEVSKQWNNRYRMKIGTRGHEGSCSTMAAWNMRYDVQGGGCTEVRAAANHNRLLEHLQEQPQVWSAAPSTRRQQTDDSGGPHHLRLSKVNDTSLLVLLGLTCTPLITQLLRRWPSVSSKHHAHTEATGRFEVTCNQVSR